MTKPAEARAFVVLPSRGLQIDIDFYTNELNFQLLAVYPSAEPRFAELSGMGLSLLLDTEHHTEPGCLLIRGVSETRTTVSSPSGTEIILAKPHAVQRQSLSGFGAEICTLRGSPPWITGSAGTHTRDLIPSRLGGGLTVSHIRIPNGGPVADRVHYHTTEFQLVFCVRGWIRLVFEGQGEPLTLMPGDCVTQPPHIRHKVLETSNGLEVIELSTPSEYVTAIDNELSLPSTNVDSGRLFHGQCFCHFQQVNAKWQTHRIPGFSAADTGIAEASANIAGVSLLKAAGKVKSYATAHAASVVFSYVLAGSVRINKQLLVAGDAFTLPPHEDYSVGDISSDAALLEVSLPGEFDTSGSLL